MREATPVPGFQPCKNCPHGAAFRAARRSWRKGAAYIKARMPAHPLGRSAPGYAAAVRAEKAQREYDLENLEC